MRKHYVHWDDNDTSTEYLYIESPGTLFIGSKEFLKDLYDVTFLVYFDSLLKRNHTNFYLLDYITKLQYHSKKAKWKLYGL